MSKVKKIRCENIRHVEGWASMVAVQLRYIGFELKYLVALVRKILVDRFGKPVGEGWVCDEESIDCYKYVMIFSCVDGDRDKFAMVEVEENEDYVFWVSSSVLDEKDLPVREYGVPVRASLELGVVESKDDSNRFLDFVEEMDFDEEVEDE
ncbi:MAG: hypothetical protein LM583_10800 [Desulfurococcaceae archaeon]|nr:hypothetical protein [Desulfurococcaceae archaeon]